MEHVECFLKKGDDRQTRYIPRDTAYVGNFCKIQEKNGKWSHDWKIVVVGTKTVEKEVEVEKKENIFKRFKKLFK